MSLVHICKVIETLAAKKRKKFGTSLIIAFMQNLILDYAVSKYWRFVNDSVILVYRFVQRCWWWLWIVRFSSCRNIMFFKSSSEELDAYYPVRAECAADVPKTRFKARVCSCAVFDFLLFDVLLRLCRLVLCEILWAI